MFYPSRFIGTVAFCALLSGGIASADSFSVSNDDPSAYSLTNSLGQSLNGGTAILGAFNSDSWSYNMENHKWSFQGNLYTQDSLKYSDLVKMQNNFTSMLVPTSIPEDQNGAINNGSFVLSGEYQQSSVNTPVYLMVTGKTGELAIFVFKNKGDNSLLNYSDIDVAGQNLWDLWLNPVSNNESNYYTECILGNVNLQTNTVQLLIPEPATATLSLLGLAALMVRRRRK